MRDSEVIFVNHVILLIWRERLNAAVRLCSELQFIHERESERSQKLHKNYEKANADIVEEALAPGCTF